MPPGALRRLGGKRYRPPGSYPLMLGTCRAGPVTRKAQPSALEWSKVSLAVDHFVSLRLQCFARLCPRSLSTTPCLHAGAEAASLGDPAGLAVVAALLVSKRMHSHATKASTLSERLQALRPSRRSDGRVGAVKGDDACMPCV